MKYNNILRPAISILLIALAVVGYFQIPKFESVEASSVNKKAAIESSFNYMVTATQDTILWTAGEVLDEGMPLYYYVLEPILTVYPTIAMDNPEEGEIKVELYIGSVDSGGNYLWKKYIRNQQTGKTMIDAKELKPIEINVLELLELASLIENELNDRRGSNSSLSILISMSTDLEEESLKHDISFTFGANGIIPPANELLSASKEIVEETPVKVLERRTLSDYLECSYFWSYGGALSFLFITALVTFKSEPKSTYKRYENWVSKATLVIDKKPDAYFDSLKELIDTAVELDKKVLYDSGSETYYILDGSNLYAHIRKNEQSINRRSYRRPPRQ